MKKLDQRLLKIYSQAMVEDDVPAAERQDYLKWLRFYLDFCFKYHHLPRDTANLALFMRKLQEKQQSIECQQQASRAVTIYYARFPDRNSLGRSESNSAYGYTNSHQFTRPFTRRGHRSRQSTVIRTRYRPRSIVAIESSIR